MNLWSMPTAAMPYVPGTIIIIVFLLSRQTLVIALFGLVAICFASGRPARAEAARHIVDRLTASKSTSSGKGG